MDNEELNLLIRVTKKRYLLDMKQSEIAMSEGISKSTISRLINKAKELGYVKVHLDFPSIRNKELEDEIKETFNLKHIFVAAVSSKDKRLRLSNVSDGLSKYLNEIISNDSTIGVTWGKTMTYISEHLIPSARRGVKIVQLNGGVSNRNVSTLSERILINFANNYNGIWHLLQVPSFVDNPEIANTLKQDSRVKEILDLIDQTETVIVSIGHVNKDSVLVKAGYFTEEEYAKLAQDGFVGDICSRYIKNDGSRANGDLYNRVIGISLEEIKRKENSICVVVGEEKSQAILAALKGGYINTLFIDEITARSVMELYKTKL